MSLSAPNEVGVRAPAQPIPVPRTPGPGGIARLADRWRVPAVLVLTSSLLTLGMFRQTLREMVETWYSSRTFSHCFLILPLFLYLVWVRRKRVQALTPEPNFWGLAVLGFLAISWLVGNIGEARVVQEFALVAILVVLLWTILGAAIARALAFPLAFLLFAVPWGLSLISPLQDATAWFAVHALTLSNVPAVLENRTLSLPSATWTVAEACSGIRYMFSSIVLGLIYASMVYRTRKRRALFVVASVLTPLFANWLRAYAIVMLAYLTNNRLAAGVDHVVYGWLFFTVVQAALFVVGFRWRETPKGSESDFSGAALTTSSGPAAVSRRNTRLIIATAASALIGLTPLAAAQLWNRTPVETGWTGPPAVVDSAWRPVAAYDRNWAPELRGADETNFQSYISGEQRVDLCWAVYSGRHGFEIVNPYNRVANPKLWSVVADGFANGLVDGEQIQVQRNVIVGGNTSRSVWTWYRVGGEYTASPGRVKFLQAKARLLGKPATAAVISVAAGFPMDGSTADGILQNFLSHSSFSSPFRASDAPGSVTTPQNSADVPHKVSR